ncbi:MAG TPA: hypothetical protein VHG28_13870 [Longimicrobiaceae bacterium]|nr:hypothetical protein [Longimicrobiaceae bacterium]
MNHRRSTVRSLLLTAACAVLSAPLAAQGPALPPAQQILDRYAQAVGGRERIARYSSAHVVSEMEMPSIGMKATIESWAAKPNRSFVRMELGAAGTTTMGFDGTVGWSNSAIQGPSLLEGAELEQMREGSDFVEAISMIPDPAGYSAIETVERTEMGGRVCYKVKLVRKSGRESFNCYDVETGLLVGMSRTQETAMGKIETTAVVSDYKEFGGVMIPTRSTGTMMGQQIVSTTRSVEFDTVQPSQFDLPQEIRALLAGSARSPGR